MKRIERKVSTPERVFNKKPRTRNAFLISGLGILNQIVSNIFAFIYRTIFIYILSSEYLGINGLFTNIIQIFSLAELGIGSIIIFRLYQPIKEDNIDQTAALMHFYKSFYSLLAGFVCATGIILMPFLPYIMKDFYDLPKDINPYIIYLMYVMQSATSYMFSYKQSLLEADQKGYINIAVSLITSCLRYSISIIALYITRKFMLVLVLGILINLLSNVMVSIYINFKYIPVFRNKSRLKKKEVIDIFKDVSAMMCHRIGSIVVISTDNIIMSMYVGTVAVGVYSNYYMIIQIVQNIISSLLGSYTSSIGNLILSSSKDKSYQLYQRLYFANMWLSSFCASSLFILLNSFIKVVWHGGKLLFPNLVVVILCVNFFLMSGRNVNTSFINASGMFVYDRVRPLIEASVNLVASVMLAKRIGVAGVFLGTIISAAITVWWREPWLLHKHIFKKGVGQYFVLYLCWGGLAAVTSMVVSRAVSYLPENVFYLIIRFLICGVGINAFYAALFWKNKHFQFFLGLIKGIVYNKLKKIRDDRERHV